jgi:hypothetical protein
MAEGEKPKVPPQPEKLVEKFAALIADHADIINRCGRVMEGRQDGDTTV